MIMSEEGASQIIDPFQSVLELIEMQVPKHEHGNFLFELHRVLCERRDEELKDARQTMLAKEKLYCDIVETFNRPQQEKLMTKY